jgi:hypothetical protein
LFTICAGLDGSPHLAQTSANWSALGLPQILAGESSLLPDPLRTVWPEIGTTSSDQPRLSDLLRFAAEHARSEWLLLLAPDTLLTPSLRAALSQLCRPGSPRRVVVGRVWYGVDHSVDPLAAIEQGAVLDPPQRFGWMLLPRGALVAAPPDLGCAPHQAASWLTDGARQLGWPILDATAAAPALRLGSAEVDGPWPTPVPPTAVVRPHQPGAPQLSLLLAAPEAELERCRQQLLPAPSLPWELIARPAESSDGPGAMAVAWTSALAAARGELAWPITAALPSLALLPVVLRSFELPAVDLLQLGIDPAPGAVVAPTAWWKRLGGWSEAASGADAMAAAVRLARERGACLSQLPFNPVA